MSACWGFLPCLETLWQFKLTNLNLNISLANILWWRIWFDFWGEFVRIWASVYFQDNMVFADEVFWFFQAEVLIQTLWLDPGKLTINSSQSETNEHNYIIKNETTQNEHRISRKCYWHFITPEVCGRFWYYFRIIFFLNLLYKNVFIFLRKVCLKSYFHSVRWEVDVSSRGSRRCCCKYSLTNGEKLKEEGLW